jgi:predicted ArsR family transcriptional regulator
MLSVAATIVNILKQTRSEILNCLKAKRRMSVEDLASRLGVSKVGVRRHLDLLRRDGLIEFEIEHQHRGRPIHIYFLTDKAELLFPNCYDEYALGVLKQVRTLYGERGVFRVIAGVADDLIASLRPRLEGLDFDRKVKRLASLINERGFDVMLRKLPDGSYLMRQRNCPMLAVASAHVQVCNEELRLYRQLLGTDVFRECRIASGAGSCDYRVLPPRGAKRKVRGENYGKS